MRDTTERPEGVEAGEDKYACERIADVLEGKEYREWK